MIICQLQPLNISRYNIIKWAHCTETYRNTQIQEIGFFWFKNVSRSHSLEPTTEKDLNTNAVILIHVKLIYLFTFSGQSTEDAQTKTVVIPMKILDLEVDR